MPSNKVPSLMALRDYARFTAGEMYPGQEGVGDQRDAARHLLASGTLAKKYSPEIAAKLGALHEITGAPIDSLLSYLGLAAPPKDRAMDTHNNSVGIALANCAGSQSGLEDVVNREAELATGTSEPLRAWVQNNGYAKGGAVDLTKAENYRDPYASQRDGPSELRTLWAKYKPDVANYVNDLNSRAGAHRKLLRDAASETTQGRYGPATAQALADMAEGYDPSSMGVIKKVGGNWLTGSTEGALRGLKSIEPMPAVELAAIASSTGLTTTKFLQQPLETRQKLIQDFYTKNPMPPTRAVDTWLDRQLKRYVEKDMGTEGDPIRALAERGVLHVDPEQLNFRAELHGKYLEEGQTAVGQSPSAKAWEGASDLKVKSLPARYAQGETLAKNPWLAKVDPETIVHSLNDPRSLPQDLGFRHLMDELRNAMDPSSGLPPELLLKYSSLPQVSVPQAVERVAKINTWRKAQALAASKAAAEGIPIRKEYPEGYRWLDVPDVSTDQKALKFAVDTGCEGGWCTQGIETAKRYGGGQGGRLHVLQGPDGSAHVQVHTQTALQPMLDTFGINLHATSPQGIAAAERGIQKLLKTWPPERRARYTELDKTWRSGQPSALEQVAAEMPASITQIKRKNNLVDTDNYPYREMVQDFVRSNKWSDVDDLANTGLRKHADGYFSDAELIDKINSFGRETATPENLDELLKYYGPAGFAKGGLVQPGYESQRVNDLVAELEQELYA